MPVVPFVLLGVGSLAGVFLDNFFDAKPSTEQLNAQEQLAKAEAEKLQAVKSIITTIAVIAAILAALYFLSKLGVFSGGR